ncbi:hypothetical protein [Brevibacillus nitrificans]|uniref:hypothetical protein n=1 Tax=Brevibacillus nitrificans TaxID=651560 RepID=UPI00261AE78B|nr:hypothetical protein [Brevibacillus nitrificans]
MAIQPIHEPKDFSTDLRKLEITDPAHANVFNPLFERLINNDALLREQSARNAEKLSNYKKTKSSKDANGIFTIVEYRRVADNTLYMKSTFSNPDAKGNYQTDTRVYYKTDGTTVDRTDIITLLYDADGDVVSEVPSE